MCFMGNTVDLNDNIISYTVYFLIGNSKNLSINGSFPSLRQNASE